MSSIRCSQAIEESAGTLGGSVSDDPLSVSDNKLKRLRSVLTLQAGRIVHGDAD